jgi:hypothetical protein
MALAKDPGMAGGGTSETVARAAGGGCLRRRPPGPCSADRGSQDGTSPKRSPRLPKRCLLRRGHTRRAAGPDIRRITRRIRARYLRIDRSLIMRSSRRVRTLTNSSSQSHSAGSSTGSQRSRYRDPVDFWNRPQPGFDGHRLPAQLAGHGLVGDPARLVHPAGPVHDVIRG